ncbi:hypothetical protein ACOSP7_029944 [Xanthoceras sorbifolium]
MPQRGLLLQNTHINCVLGLLKIFNGSPDTVTVVNVHCFTLKVGFLANLPTSTSLLTAYSRAGDFRSSWDLFNETCNKDVIFWNAIITASVENKCLSMALHFFVEMIEVGIGFDSTTLLIVVSALSQLNFLKQGGVVHCLSVKAGMLSDCSLCNALMDMYAKCGELNSSECMFAGMECRDIVSWNTIVSGCLHNDHPEKSLLYFREMTCCSGEQVRPDNTSLSLSTLLAILPSCDSPEFLKFGTQIHCWQLKLGFSNNILAVNSLMHMYINCGDLMASYSLLQKISHIGDTSCWNTVIVACTHNGHLREALETFNLMRQESNASHDSITLVNVISVCGILQLAFQGRSLHGLAVKSSIILDTRVQNSLITMYSRCKDVESASLVFKFMSNHNSCSWNCMISAFSQNKAEMKAFDLFCRLKFEHNEFTIVSILSACTQLGVISHGKQIHGHVYRLGFQKNSFISAALVDMYSNCGRLDIACKIFENSREKSDAAWNSMISAYGYHSRGIKAIELFHEMCNSGIRPNKSTFVSLLSACSHSGLVNEGLWYYRHMLEKYEVKPVTDHHVCLVDMLGRSGKLHEAYEFIMSMPTQPEAGVWGAMLSACNYHGDTQMGKKVAELLFELEPENVGYYISLSNMYVASGRWKDAVEIREIIQNKNLRKIAGYSLIDVGFK